MVGSKYRESLDAISTCAYNSLWRDV